MRVIRAQVQRRKFSVKAGIQNYFRSRDVVSFRQMRRRSQASKVPRQTVIRAVRVDARVRSSLLRPVLTTYSYTFCSSIEGLMRVWYFRVNNSAPRCVHRRLSRSIVLWNSSLRSSETDASGWTGRTQTSYFHNGSLEYRSHVLSRECDLPAFSFPSFSISEEKCHFSAQTRQFCPRSWRMHWNSLKSSILFFYLLRRQTCHLPRWTCTSVSKRNVV